MEPKVRVRERQATADVMKDLQEEHEAKRRRQRK